jgi:hydroxymethylbilane synthase
MCEIRIGSRGSQLALVQTNAIADALRRLDPELQVSIEIVHTQGDLVTDRPLSEIGGSGLFIKEIEQALLDERIDLAVHSLKDLPSALPGGFALAAVTERIDPRDALVSRGPARIEDLSEGARLATGSLRRRSQLLALRPDLAIEDLRGNVPTRLGKFDASDWEAIVLAAAGLTRLGLAGRIRAPIPVASMLPAVGQGALALETREADAKLRERVAELDHAPTALAIRAERAFLARLEGGCQVPIAAYGEAPGDRLSLEGYVGSVDGQRHVRQRVEGPAGAPEELGLELAESMLRAGADAIVRELGGEA